MSLSIGIVGLPNVGKSTLFQALTKKQVDISNYPFCTIDPNVGIVEVPDKRLQQLTRLSNSKRTIPAVIEFTDIAGLVRGASKGEGLGNQFLSHIRETDAILFVLRVFESAEIHHVEQSVDPLRDLKIIETELALKDLETAEKRLEKVQKEARAGIKEAIIESAFLEGVIPFLNEGRGAYEYMQQTGVDEEAYKIIIKNLQFLTSKPSMVALNAHSEEIPQALKEYLDVRNLPYVILNIREELDSAGLTQEERKEFGLGDSKLAFLIRLAYERLSLITFLTTGEDETRAWTITKGAKAPQASGVIHTDFEEKFIRAEVISYEALLQAGGWAAARSKGLLRVEGKDYVIQDGDVMVVRHG